jgi:hypothetical protein
VKFHHYYILEGLVVLRDCTNHVCGVVVNLYRMNEAGVILESSIMNDKE